VKSDYFQENIGNANILVYGEAEPEWNEVRQTQPQSIESWKTTSSPESKFLDRSYGSKIKAAYDLFPIQEVQ